VLVEVPLACLGCGRTLHLPGDSSEYECLDCRRRQAVRRCFGCGVVLATEAFETKSQFTCSFCWTTHEIGGDPRASLATVSERAEALRLRGLDPVAPRLILVSPGTVVGGYGTALRPGAGCCLTASDEAVTVFTPDLHEMGRFPLAGLVALQLGGPGAVTTGGGFVGGGFGLKGAAEGILISSLLNTLTTKTEVNTLVRVTGRDAELIVHTSAATPGELELKLSPVLGRLRSREVSQPAEPGRDLTSELERLARLRESGLLSDVEFAQAKAKLLGA
jgi:hypothetical protein